MPSREVSVFGAGYVGLVTGACLSSSGHRVTVLETDDTKLASLRAGRTPFHEPGLDELICAGRDGGTLRFHDTLTAESFGEFVFVAVGTPSTIGGAADLRFVRAVIDQIARGASPGTIVVMKSTVPPGTGELLSSRLSDAGIAYVSNPEFLREGNAVEDWFHADRIVLGGDDAAVAAVASLYKGIDSPVVSCDVASAELIKYASNAFLATKISYANEIARLCESVDADVLTVMRGVGLDKRIGPAFLNAGIGYGGSCFPKDTRALDFLASTNGYDFRLLKAVIDVNSRQRLLPVIALRKAVGSLTSMRVAVLGLTFKPNTDDTREAPAAEIVEMLLAEGAVVTAYDPVGRLELDTERYSQVPTLDQAVAGACATIVATEWPQIASADWAPLVDAMSPPRLIFDGRNCLDAQAVREAGGTYAGVGHH